MLKFSENNRGRGGWSFWRNEKIRPRRKGVERESGRAGELESEKSTVIEMRNWRAEIKSLDILSRRSLQ